MAIDYDKWTKDFGGQEALEELKKAQENKGGSGEFDEIPDGVYRCKLEKLELAASKTGKPMVKGVFAVSTGKYKNWKLFLNQVFTRGYPQHKALEFLRSMEVFEASEIDFDGDFKDFNDLLLDILENSEWMEWDIDKSKDGDFTKLEVIKTYQ